MTLDSPNFDNLDAFAFDTRRVDKPWGWELIWALSEFYCGKVLFVRAGHSLSLQFHKEKDESWYVQDGRVELELARAGDTITNTEIVGEGAAFRLRAGTIHRLRALEDAHVLEVSTPHLEDIVRLEDSYGREHTTEP